MVLDGPLVLSKAIRRRWVGSVVGRERFTGRSGNPNSTGLDGRGLSECGELGRLHQAQLIERPIRYHQVGSSILLGRSGETRKRVRPARQAEDSRKHDSELPPDSGARP